MNETALWIVFGVLCGLILLMPLGFVAYRMRHYLLQGWFRGIFICEDGDIVIKTVRSSESDRRFTLKIKGELGTYDKVESVIRRTTRAHIPTSFYQAGNETPLNPNTLKPVTAERNALRYNQVARNTVARDLLTAFKSNKIDAIMALFIMTGVVLIGFVLLGVFINSKLTEM